VSVSPDSCVWMQNAIVALKISPHGADRPFRNQSPEGYIVIWVAEPPRTAKELYTSERLPRCHGRPTLMVGELLALGAHERKADNDEGKPGAAKT